MDDVLRGPLVSRKGGRVFLGREHLLGELISLLKKWIPISFFFFFGRVIGVVELCWEKCDEHVALAFVAWGRQLLEPEFELRINITRASGYEDLNSSYPSSTESQNDVHEIFMHIWKCYVHVLDSSIPRAYSNNALVVL